MYIWDSLLILISKRRKIIAFNNPVNNFYEFVCYIFLPRLICRRRTWNVIVQGTVGMSRGFNSSLLGACWLLWRVFLVKFNRQIEISPKSSVLRAHMWLSSRKIPFKIPLKWMKWAKQNFPYTTIKVNNIKISSK